MSASLWQRFLTTATARGGAVAILHGDRSADFAGLLAMAAGWAHRLAAMKGSRVVIAAANSVDLAAAVPGIWISGAIPVFVNADAPDSHLRHAVLQTEAGTVLVSPGRSFGETPARVIALQPGNWGDPRDLPQVPDQGEPDQDGWAPGSIVYTSGSTGAPKGVVQAAATLASGVDRVAATLGYQLTDSILCPIPFAFDYGWGQLLSLLLGGIPLVLPEPRTAAGICAALAAHRPTVLAGVPAVFADLLSGLAPIRETDRRSVRLITNTGSRIPDPVRRGLSELFPDAALSLNYGLTETYRSASLPLAEAAQCPASVGYALPGVVLTVLRPDGTDADGSEAARTQADVGEEGEIIHRGAGVFLGYWNDPERTAKVLRPDPLWAGPAHLAPMAVFTGDLGHKDAGGRLYIHGRRDRQMKSMGVRVSPDEVEQLLLASGLLREVAVVARSHDVVGDLIVAMVSLPEGPADHPADLVLRALKRHARATLSPYMQPRDYVVLPALPRYPNGKVDYPALTRRAAEQGVRNG